MKIIKYVTITVAMLLALVGMSGCNGYQPSSKYAKTVVGETVSTEIKISMEDPENTVIIKDAVEEAVIMRFKAALRPKGKADTDLLIKLKNVKFVPLQYNKDGYVVTYRAIVSLGITRTTTSQDNRPLNYLVKLMFEEGPELLYNPNDMVRLSSGVSKPAKDITIKDTINGKQVYVVEQVIYTEKFTFEEGDYITFKQNELVMLDDGIKKSAQDVKAGDMINGRKIETVEQEEIDVTTATQTSTYNVSGYYDFGIEPQAIISDQARFEAIRAGAAKAIDSFIAQVSAEGSLKSN
jgi:ribosomal protein L21